MSEMGVCRAAFLPEALGRVRFLGGCLDSLSPGPFLQLHHWPHHFSFPDSESLPPSSKDSRDSTGPSHILQDKLPVSRSLS